MFRFRPRADRLPSFAAACLALLGLVLASPSAQAIPAFARQTGSACADCHAGAYGPALTPYGMRFKLNGFTDTDGNGTKIPLSMQLIESHTAPARGESSTKLTEGDLFLAGRLTDHVGGIVKVEADHTGPNTYNTKLATLDLRYVAQDLKLRGKDLTLGVSVNNSPSQQDPIGDLPATALLGPPGVTGTLLNPSSPSALTDRVIGAGVYALYDHDWYGEVGSYRALPLSQQDNLGYSRNGDPGRLSDTAYLRLSYMKDLKRQFFSAGVVALTTHRQLPRSAPADDITDLGYDLSYQYLGNREHIAQLSYVSIYERRRYGSTPPSPFVPGTFARQRAGAHDQVFSATYTFRQSYGVTWSHLISTGSHDQVRYGLTGNPDTTSNYISVFWTPFGRDESYTSIANLKLAATWFRFTQFGGRSSNIFLAPPGAPVTNAGDLNAFVVSASLAF